MLIQRKTFDAAEFKATNDGTGIAEMIVSVFNNVDSARERILPGFFSESLATRRNAQGAPRVKGVWSHDWELPIGKTLDAVELMPGDPRLPLKLRDLGGLWIKGQFNLDTQRGREAYSDLKFGSIDEFSIGYRVNEDDVDPQTGVRDLIRGDLYEWSPVLVGANPATELLSIKSLDADIFRRAADVAASLSGTAEDKVAAALAVIRSEAERAGFKSEVMAAEPPPTDPPIEASDDDADPTTERFADQYERVLLEVSTLATRSHEIADLRAKAGRVLSDANRRRLSSLSEQLGELQTQIADLLTSTEPAPPPEAPAKSALTTELDDLYARFVAVDALHGDLARFARVAARGDS